MSAPGKPTDGVLNLRESTYPRETLVHPRESQDPRQDEGSGPRGGARNAHAFNSRYQVVESEYSELSLREILATLMRRKMILISAVLLAVVLSLTALSIITPLYSAEALILIEPHNKQAMLIETAVGAIGGDETTVRSETYILQSRAMVDRVVERLALDTDPEFVGSPEAAPGAVRAWLSSAVAAVRDRLPFLEASNAEPSQPDELADALKYNRLVNRFSEALSVGAINETRVISISFMSSDPQKAQAIANTVADEYMNLREEVKLESSSRVSTWMDNQVVELQATVREGEAAIESLRQQYGLVEGTRGDLGSQELAQVSSQLVLARAERAEAEVRLRQIQALVESPGGANTSVEVLDSPLIQGLRAQQSEIQGRVAELSSELGDQHPRMQQLRAEASDIGNKIEAEIKNVIAGLSSQLSVAKARERSFESALADIKKRVSRSNRNDIEIRSLERDVEANRAMLTNLLNRQKQTAPQEDAQFLQADARLISMAGLPTSPAYPNKRLVLGLAVLGSFVLGCLIILLIEVLDNGFRSIEQLDEQTGIPAFGFIPETRLKASLGSEIADLVDNPSSAFAESIRTLNWSVKLAFQDAEPEVLLVTSSVPNEGKSTIASALCFTQGHTGKRTLIIDADIRRPTMHQRFKVDQVPGLSEYLAGKADISEVVKDPRSTWGVNVIPAGHQPLDAANLIGRGRMSELLDTLRPMYDMIIIDSPPVLVGADARLLSQFADATIMVVRWGKTQRQTVKHALGNLEKSGARLAGTLLTMVEVKKYAQYTYGDSGTYAGDLAKYYARL